MNQGDVYSVSLDPTRGSEQAGQRPVLIVTPADFNRLTPPVVLPITRGGNFARMAGFVVSLSGCGSKTDGVILCHQPRTVDIAARGGRFIEALPQSVVEEALARLAALLDVE